MTKLLSAIAVCLLVGGLSACSDSSTAKEALTKAGYSNIKIQGHSWFACSDDDFYSTKFTATNPVRKQVSGTVCNGLLFKNATIRF